MKIPEHIKQPQLEHYDCEFCGDVTEHEKEFCDSWKDSEGETVVNFHIECMECGTVGDESVHLSSILEI